MLDIRCGAEDVAILAEPAFRSVRVDALGDGLRTFPAGLLLTLYLNVM